MTDSAAPAIQLPGYRILQKIGEGGMALVYKGIQESLKRPVAIKVLQQDMTQHPEVHKRFQRESLIIARLNHPHIIHVIDRGVTEACQPYFVMEYVSGVPLDQAIKNNQLDDARRTDILVQLCKALSYAHKNGVIHRDLKPANVLLDAEGNVRMLDFGIAHFYSKSAKRRHTQTGDVMGTAAYMAPEQQDSADTASVQSDLYSLGVIMYELYTGTRPVGRFRTPQQLNPMVSDSVDELILRMLDPDPAQRPGSADEVRTALLHGAQGQHLSEDQLARAGEDLTDLKRKFTLLDIIKEDHFSSVYLYEDRATGQLLAVKKTGFSMEGLRENETLCKLQHPNLARVMGVSKTSKALVVVTEYISGGSLQDRLAGPISWSTFMHTARDICEGLAYAHKHKVVHGNLRPSNILLGENGEVKLVDFGLDEHYRIANQDNWYCLRGEKRCVANDVFAAGAIFYQAVTGKPPQFRDGKLMRGRAFTELPEQVQRLIGRMLSLQPQDRHASFDEILAEIRGGAALKPKAAEPPPRDERPPSRGGRKGKVIAGAFGLLLLMTVGATLTWMVMTDRMPLPGSETHAKSSSGQQKAGTLEW